MQRPPSTTARLVPAPMDFLLPEWLSGYATREKAVAKWKRNIWKKNQTKILLLLLLTGIGVTVYYILP